MCPCPWSRQPHETISDLVGAHYHINLVTTLAVHENIDLVITLAVHNQINLVITLARHNQIDLVIILAMHNEIDLVIALAGIYPTTVLQARGIVKGLTNELWTGTTGSMKARSSGTIYLGVRR
jgi:hypothetical protein